MRINLSKYNFIDISPEALKKQKEEFVKSMVNAHEKCFKTREEAEKAFTDVWNAANPEKKTGKTEKAVTKE